MNSVSLPLQVGDTGSAVRDLTARLVAAGFNPASDPMVFDAATEQAVRHFQESRGLEPDGRCTPETWSALVEAGYGFGDRLLYLTSPMLRGDDVADLQMRLGALGFDAGRVDGIFGPMTRDAVLEFQQNVGLVPDEVCGPDTVGALRRLHPRAGQTSVAGVRERHRLRTRTGSLTLRVAFAHLGDAEAVLGSAAVDLRAGGATVAAFVGDDWSEIASDVNEFEADVCLALQVSSAAGCEASYFEVPGFHSVGGLQLARLVAAELPSNPRWPLTTVLGRRSAILRETRAPSVILRLGPADEVLGQRHLIAASLTGALLNWSTSLW